MLRKTGIDNNVYLSETRLLDFKCKDIQKLLNERGWKTLNIYERIGAAYDFVRNEVKFGYNASDDIRASHVLSDGYGQCNTKGTLLMALLRGLGIACRLHGFTIHKSLQRGVVPELVYRLAPDNILHSWVEVQFEGEWRNLEGFILDEEFLRSLQNEFAPKSPSLCAYGVGTACLSSPPVEWMGSDTYIQKTGINNDFGVYNSPDDFYAEHMQGFSPLLRIAYAYGIRHWMNARTRAIRHGRIPKIPA
ncbi:transglutaminase-like domain-containing protein [Flexibacterium corallicola]|uniref:transglutaminase-like domain-containing protein n=1 Tax=Flexibacterium corallicola TaxID=3037259 RepID=UPI00286ECF48|nr:transglutaminase family protein [Pseudovibrio sp. M1P-2-3]